MRRYLMNPPTAMPRPATFYRADGYCAEESVGHLMKRVLGALMQEIDKRLEPEGLTHAQWKPLFMLRKAGGATVAEMARDLQIDPGAMTRMLDRLETKGLCRRARSTDDRRVVNLELTPEGERAADLVPVALAEVQNAYLAGFTRAEWQTLKGLLERMLDNAGACREARCAAGKLAEASEDTDV